MKGLLLDNYAAVSEYAATLVEEQVRGNAQSVLGLATGATPLGLYENICNSFEERGVSYKDVRTINLDEYLGLERTHPESYYTFMNEKLFKHIDLAIENAYIPDGKPSSVGEECVRYDKILDCIGPINLQILGIGTNGHIGFNEPGTNSNSTTHIVELTPSTRKSNAHFFQSFEEIPTHAITMGIKSILKSEKIILLASGESKAKAVKTLLSKRVTERFPASFLWNHDNVTLIVDRDAYQLVELERQ